MNLYTLTDQIYALAEKLETVEALDGKEIEAEALRKEIDALGLEADAKLESLWRWIKNLDAEADAIGEEKKRLASRQSIAENRAKSLKGYVASCLGEGNKWKAVDGVAAFGWRKSEAAIVENEDAVPDAWCAFERKPVLTEIKKTLKEGGEVPGARLEVRQNLQVK